MPDELSLRAVSFNTVSQQIPPFEIQEALTQAPVTPDVSAVAQKNFSPLSPPPPPNPLQPPRRWQPSCDRDPSIDGPPAKRKPSARDLLLQEFRALVNMDDSEDCVAYPSTFPHMFGLKKS